jgi:SPP1 family predicted phage head-tail adaptor
MEAGPLDTLVTIEQRSVVRDAYGAEVNTWVTFATVWAGFEDYGSSERLRADEVQAQRQTRVTLRWVAGLNEAMRIVGGGRTLQIKGMAEIRRQRGWQLLCEDWNG